MVSKWRPVKEFNLKKLCNESFSIQSKDLFYMYMRVHHDELIENIGYS